MNRLSDRLLALQAGILALTLEGYEGSYLEELRAQHRRLVSVKYGPPAPERRAAA